MKLYCLKKLEIYYNNVIPIYLKNSVYILLSNNGSVIKDPKILHKHAAFK